MSGLSLVQSFATRFQARWTPHPVIGTDYRDKGNLARVFLLLQLLEHYSTKVSGFEVWVSRFRVQEIV